MIEPRTADWKIIEGVEAEIVPRDRRGHTRRRIWRCAHRWWPPWTLRLRRSDWLQKQPVHRLRLHEFARLVQVVVNDRLRGNADSVIDAGEQFGGMHGLVLRARASRVTFAVDVAALRTRACDDCGVAIRPVVASIGSVHLAARAHALLGAAAEFAERHDERFLEQAA